MKMSHPNQCKFLKCPLGELVVKSQMTLGTCEQHNLYPPMWGDLFVFIQLQDDFFSLSNHFLIFFLYFFPPSFSHSLITLFPSLGGKFSSLPTLSFSLANLVSFYFLFFILCSWKRCVNMCLHYGNKDKCTFFWDSLV